MLKNKQLIYLVASCLIYVGLLVAIPFVIVPGSLLLAIAAQFAVVVVLMLVQISIVRWFAGVTMKPLWALTVLVVCLGLWAGTVARVTQPYGQYEVKDAGSFPVLIGRSPKPATMPIPLEKSTKDAKGDVRVEKVVMTGVLRPSDVDFRLSVFDRRAGMWRIFTNLITILAATAFGYLVSFILRHPNIVLPVGALSAYVDIWTVLIGPTARAIEKAPHVVNAVSVSMPAIASHHRGSFQAASYIGPADFIFIALFFGAVYRLKMSPSRTFWLIFLAVTLGMISVLCGFPSMGLPALVLIGPAVIIANYKHFKLAKQEWIAMGITAALLVGFSIVLMPYVLKR